MNVTATLTGKQTRIRAFIDYWNIQLTINDRKSAETRESDFRAKIDWKNIGEILSNKAAEIANVTKNYSYDGVIIYSSFNPKTGEGKSFKKWMTTFLDRQPGIQVNCLERQPKNPPTCPTCHQEITICPHTGCGALIKGTVEKGVDTFIGTDMIRLAWENAYDIAVLASCDRDLVPAVKFLDSKGLKVIQAGFPPSGINLSTACWASFDIISLGDEIFRS